MDTSKTIETDEVQKWLLHRPPFLLIDYATDFIKGESLTGHTKLESSDIWFSGHFPGNPIMPGVLLVESMAQAGALLASKSLGIDPATKTILFSTVEKAKFRRSVVPPATLDIPVRIVNIRRNFVRFSGQVLVEGHVVANSSFMAVAVENTK